MVSLQEWNCVGTGFRGRGVLAPVLEAGPRGFSPGSHGGRRRGDEPRAIAAVRTPKTLVLTCGGSESQCRPMTPLGSSAFTPVCAQQSVAAGPPFVSAHSVAAASFDWPVRAAL